MATQAPKIIDFKDIGIPRRLSPEASRMAALEAARGLLLEAGPQAVTLKAVAGQIGRTHANWAKISAAKLLRQLPKCGAEP